jgi:hypothetical protein
MPRKGDKMKMLSKKQIDYAKQILVKDITKKIGLGQYITFIGYETDEGEVVHESLTVAESTEYIPGHWGSGIRQPDYKLGEDLSLQEFVEEEGLRKLRNVFPEQANFITWAWYN